jgi:hypothetical protein
LLDYENKLNSLPTPLSLYGTGWFASFSIIASSKVQFVTDVYITAPEGIDKSALKKELYIQGVATKVIKDL